MRGGHTFGEKLTLFISVAGGIALLLISIVNTSQTGMRILRGVVILKDARRYMQVSVLLIVSLESSSFREIFWVPVICGSLGGSTDERTKR